jgi:hypothetical protein
MDTDNSNSLSDGELREGFAAYGLSLSSDDQQAISDYVAKESLEGELTLAQWLEFVKPDDTAPEVVSGATSPARTFEQETGEGAEEEAMENPLKLGSQDEDLAVV